MSQIFYIAASIILGILFLIGCAVLVIFAAVMQHEERMSEHAGTQKAQPDGIHERGNAARRYPCEMP